MPLALIALVATLVVIGTLTGVLVAVYVGLVTLLGESVGRSSSLVAAATLAIAAPFQPVRRRVQAQLDRRFDRAGYDTARAIESLLAQLRDEGSLAALHRNLLTTGPTRVQPSSAGLLLRPSRRDA